MISHNLINALGQALFESCIQAMLIYVALQVFIKLFPMLSAKYRYVVHYFALTAIFGWFLITVAKIYGQTVDAPAYVLTGYYQNIHQNYPAPSLLDQVKQLINQYSLYITGVYVLGLIIHIIGLIKGLFHIRYIRNKKNLMLSPVWTQRAALLRKKLGLLKNIPVYISEHINIPLTIGHLKPIIIFPLAIINNLDAAQVESILLHELAHIKRHDYLFNIVQTVMETLLCFNPFSWLIAKAIRNEREYCCDDMVTGNIDNNYSYAQALYLIAQQNSYAASLTMASSGESKYPLLNRIKRLNHMKTDHQLPKQHLAIIVTIIIISLLLAWAVPQYTLAKNNKSTKSKTVVSHISKTNTLSVKQPVNNSVAYLKHWDIVPASVIADTLKQLNDTTKKKKYKIVMEDENGNKKEFNSVDDLSPEDKDAFFKDNMNFKFNVDDSLKFAGLAKQFNSPEWKKRTALLTANALVMTKQLVGTEWKRQAETLAKKFNSPEWKKQQEEMAKQFNGPEWKKQTEEMAKNAEAMAKQFNSPEWKKQQEDWAKAAKDMAKQFNSPEWKKQTEAMAKQFNSPEWKKQTKELAKQLSSPEWKKQQEELVKHALEMSKMATNPEWLKKQEELDQKMQDLEKQQAELQKEYEKSQKAVQDTIKK